MDEIIKFIKDNPEAGRRVIAKEFGISERKALEIKRKIYPDIGKPQVTRKEVMQYLKERGLSEDSINEFLVPQRYSPRIIGNTDIREFKIGIIGDTHLCDKACALDELHNFYEYCSKLGIQHIVNAGDVTAGISVYRGQEFDLVAHGFDDQLNYVSKYYPKIDGITTHTISGNHDMSFKVKAGVNFIEALSKERDDIKWIGDYSADLSINGVSIKLQHGDAGNAYALSYRAQKFIEKMGAGQKPQIYVLGHYHAAMTMFYRNIHAYLPGCWQRPNDFSVRKGLPNMIGGYITHIKVEDDSHNTIKSINNELVAYYD